MVDSQLPSGWHWGGGEVAGGSKTYWFYTNLRFHYRGKLYTDPNRDWTVFFYEEKGLRDDGDIEVAEYPCDYGSFSTEQQAVNWLVEKAADLIDY